MAKLIYIGTHDAVEVPLPYGGVVVVKNGEEANLPDSLAKQLLDQPDNWIKSKGGDK